MLLYCCSDLAAHKLLIGRKSWTITKNVEVGIDGIDPRVIHDAMIVDTNRHIINASVYGDLAFQSEVINE